MKTEQEIKRKLAALRTNVPWEEEKMKGWEAALKWILDRIEVDDGKIDLPKERLEIIDAHPIIEDGFLWINLRGLEMTQNIQKEEKCEAIDVMKVETILIRVGDILERVEEFKRMMDHEI